MTTGIQVRHTRTCKTETGGGCTCRPAYRAEVYSRRDGKKIRKTFPTLAAARVWRADASSALNRGRLRAPTPTTVAAAAAAFMEDAKAGRLPKRGGAKYKPSTLRGYARGLERILPVLGHLRLAEVTRADVQDLVDALVADGLSASSVANALDPLRAIVRRAIRRDQLSVDPTASLELRAPDGRRDRIAAPAEMAALLAALPEFERVLWATAAYTGMRRGELRALRRSDVDLPGRVVHVARGWDDVDGEQDGKSEAAERDVPILDVFAPLLAARLLALPAGGDPLVFGRTPEKPFATTTVATRARAAWEAWNERARAEHDRAGRKGNPPRLDPIGLHESRHTCASTLIAAGANPKLIQVVMGHANIAMTFDRYGHLFPTSLEDAAAAANRFLARAGVI